MGAKSAYVGVMHGAGRVADRLGVPELSPGRRGARAHLRSLLDIHDIEALISWDIPWWTYRAVDTLDSILSRRQQTRVFEYGSGASTVWLARRVTSVDSVEHDPAWVDVLRPRIASFDNVTLHAVAPTPAAGTPAAPSGLRGWRGLDFSAYVDTITEVGGIFDLIVVDGRARMACLERSVPHLAPDGILVVDNSRRPRYQQTLRTVPLDVERLRGAAPGLPYPDETSLLRHRGGASR